MAVMTTITPATPVTEHEFSGTGTIRNPANGTIAGEVQWTNPADVPTIAADLRAAQRDWGAARSRRAREGAGPVRSMDG